MTDRNRIKKILLLNPPAIVKASWAQDIGSFPLGLAYMAAVLEQNHFETRILDCFIEGFSRHEKIGNQLVRIGLEDEEIVRAVAESAPDLIGISVQFSCQLASALHIGALIKRTCPDAVTAAGGSHVSAAPRSIPAGAFDWVIIGEGEYRLLQLARMLTDPGGGKPVPGVLRPAEALSADLEAVKPGFIENLDELPFPLYKRLPLEKYWQAGGGRRRVNMIATRGCPFRCVFCSIHIIMGRAVRYRSVENVLAEIVSLKQDFDIEQIYFEDDNITFDMAWAKTLFARIARAGLALEIYFRNGIRADRVDGELLELMRLAGVKRVWFAPESGRQETLDRIIKKKMRLEDCENAVRLAKKAGLDVTCFLVIGFPEETLRDIKKTIQYGRRLRRLGCDSIWVSCAVPYPGTALFAECEARGILDPGKTDYQSLSTMDSIISNEWFTAEDVKKIRDRAMLRLNRRSPFEKTALALSALKKGLVILFTDPLLFVSKVAGRMARAANKGRTKAI